MIITAARYELFFLDRAAMTAAKSQCESDHFGCDGAVRPGALAEQFGKQSLDLCQAKGDMGQRNDQNLSFGEWLLAKKNGGAIANLIAAAKVDPAFPHHGSPDDVRKRLNEIQSDGLVRALIDDAEMEWMGY